MEKERQPGSVFGYACDYFKGRLDRHEYERSTYATNLKHLRAWEKVIGDMPIRDLKKSDIRHAIEVWFDDGRDATTVDKRITALKEVCDVAVDDGLIDSSPFAGIRRPKKPYKELNGVNDKDKLLEVDGQGDPNDVYVLVKEALGL